MKFLGSDQKGGAGGNRPTGETSLGFGKLVRCGAEEKALARNAVEDARVELFRGHELPLGLQLPRAIKDVLIGAELVARLVVRVQLTGAPSAGISAPVGCQVDNVSPIF